MKKTKKNPTLQNALKQFKQALTHKEQENPEKAIELLLQIIEQTRKAQNTLEEVHLIAIVQENLGMIYMELEKLNEALYYFSKAVLNISMVVEHNPQMTQLHENQALILLDMALIYRSLQQYDEAIKHYKQAINAYKQDEAHEKENIYAIKAEIFMVNAEVADMQEMNRNKAIESILKAIEAYELALKIQPKNFEYRKEKALAQILLADNYSQNYDRMVKALELLEEAIQTFTYLLKEVPDDEQIIISRANSTAHIGRIYRELGEIYVAVEYFDKAITSYKNYLENEPLNYEVLDHIGVNLNNIANIYISTQQKEQVPTLLNQAIEHYNSILEESEKRENNHYDTQTIKEVIYHKAIAQIDLSRFYIETSALRKAKELLTESISTSEQAIKKNDDNFNFLNQKALAMTVQAEIYEIEHNQTKAISSYQGAIAIFDQSLQLKPNDIFTLNHRGLAKGNIVTSCIVLNKKKEGDFWFAEAMKDYDEGTKLNPTFTDILINRATLLSDWAYANKHSVEQNELLQLLHGAMRDLNVILEENTFHFSAMNNKLTISSDIASIYKERGESQKVLDIYYEEVKNYNKFLNIYNNDLMSFMNAGVSKLLLSKELIEQKNPKEALSFLKSSLNDYAVVLKSDPHDMETLCNQSLSMREIIDIETSSEHLEKSIKLNRKILELYDDSFLGIEKEKDSHTLTYNMTFPLQSLIYAYSHSPHIDVEDIVYALEMTKAKTLKMLMSQTVESTNFTPTDRDKFQTLQKQQEKLKEKLKALKIEIEENQQTLTETKGLKSVPKETLKSMKTSLDKSLKEREELYEKLHHYNKEFSKILSLNNDIFHIEIVEKLDEKSVVLYPIYDDDRSELQVVALYRENNEIKITIENKILEDNLRFYNFILLIKDVEDFFRLEKEKERKKKITRLNSKYKTMPKKVLELLFELNKDLKIINLKITHGELMNNHRYQVLNMALEYLGETIIKSIPKGKNKIYFSPFADLTMLPLHAIKISKESYLIDNYEIVYIPSLALWSTLLETKEFNDKNLYISQDHPHETLCYDEVIACQSILEGEHKNDMDTLDFKEKVDQKSFDILHLSVHGKADLKAPLNSGLLFKESQLSILEIQALKFQSNLIILSACESNLAKTEGADELLAFERAFMIAGANNVISTFDLVDGIKTKAFIKKWANIF